VPVPFFRESTLPATRLPLTSEPAFRQYDPVLSIKTTWALFSTALIELGVQVSPVASSRIVLKGLGVCTSAAKLKHKATKNMIDLILIFGIFIILFFFIIKY
jgi:hypothetical protein